MEEDEEEEEEEEVRFDSAGKMCRAPHSCQAVHSGATSMVNNITHEC